MYQHKKYINTNFYCTVNLNNILSPNNDIKVLQKGLSDTINSNTFRCNTKTCKSQFGFYPSDNVISFVIKKIYDFCYTTNYYVSKLSFTLYIQLLAVDVHFNTLVKQCKN